MTWIEFRQLITDKFDVEEIRTICFDLGINYDNLRGEGKEAKVRELVTLARRSDRTSELVEILAEHRDRVLWAVPTSKLDKSTLFSGNNLLVFAVMLAFSFVIIVIVLSGNSISTRWLSGPGEPAQSIDQNETDYKEPFEVYTPVATLSSIVLTELAESMTTRESGLQRKCLDSDFWVSLKRPSDEEGQCLQLDEWGVKAQEQGLIILNDGSSEEQRQGVFTPISNSSVIKLDVTINTLFTPFENNLANLAIGVIPVDSMDLTLDGQLIYQKESPEEGYPIFLKYQERSSYGDYIVVDDQYLRHTEDTPQQLMFVLQGERLAIFVDDVLVQNVELPFAEKAFWIGYRIPAAGKIHAYISDLEIE